MFQMKSFKHRLQLIFYLNFAKKMVLSDYGSPVRKFQEVLHKSAMEIKLNLMTTSYRK